MKREAVAVWAGNLVDGAGSIETQSGALKNLGYSFKGRFLDE
jgi:osmotically inducible protein OsmC